MLAANNMATLEHLSTDPIFPRDCLSGRAATGAIYTCRKCRTSAAKAYLAATARLPQAAPAWLLNTGVIHR